MLIPMRIVPVVGILLLGLLACSEADGSARSVAEHAHGTHGGLAATFRGGDLSGYFELKLHDDEGDLEIWLSQDEEMTIPFDLPIDATVEVEFADMGGRKVTLRSRNETQNEDESGKPNIRDGKTNYFIYPSQAGEDASWLKGEEFESVVSVRFALDGGEFVSQKMVLKPHLH